MLNQPPPPLEELPEPPPLDESNRSRSSAPASKGKRGPRVVRSSTSSSGAREQSLKQIREDLTQAFVLSGTALVNFAPVSGTYLIARGPQGADIICNIARKDERVLRALMAVTRYAVWGEAALFVAGLGVAVTVDLGQQDPNSFIVQRVVGVDILEEVYRGRSQQQNGSGAPAAATAPPGWPTAGQGQTTPLG